MKGEKVMKLLKAKIGLLVLAVACFCMGITGLHTVTVQANIDTTGFTMANGAYINLMEGKSGISWTTTVSQDFYTAAGITAESKFGVLVAPTNSFVGELTHETVLTKGSVKDLPVSGSVGANQTYRSVIYYDNILDDYAGALSDEEVLAKAYAMELTARAYVSVNNDGQYIYCDLAGLGINTSRSARQVAMAAELSGEIDEDFRNNEDPEVQALANVAAAYYGGSYEKTGESDGSVGTPLIDLENPTANTEITIALSGEYQEALIGTDKITASYSAGTLTVTDATGVKAGEKYVTVFTSAGTYVAPVIVATKVFTQMSDFESFMYLRNNYTSKITPAIQEGIDAAQCVHDGYYVLANDIDASAYDRPVVGNQSGFVGNANFVGQPFGLTGTFNGLGHNIDGLTLTNAFDGIFGLINGGTVKNFALTNLKAAEGKTAVTALSYLAIDPVIENVYVHINGNYTMNQQFGAFYYIHQSAANTAKVRNVFLDCNFIPSDASVQVQGGSLVYMLYGTTETSVGTGKDGTDEKFIEFANVYAVSNVGFGYRANSKNQGYNYVYAENEREAFVTDGTVVFPEGKTAVTWRADATFFYCKNAYHYTTMDAFKAANHDLTAFTGSSGGGCWTLVDGVPTWNSTLS